MTTTTLIDLARRIPVRRAVDVFIAGGGPSGVAAALAAHRQGRTVYLAEGYSCFGGMGTAGLVPVFLFFGDGVNFLADGVGREVYLLLKKMAGRLCLDDPHGAVSIDAEALKRAYDELMVGEGVPFTFQTHLIGVEARAGAVDYAICAAKSGIFAVQARTFIDCTGDGDLAAWAGAPFEKGDESGNLMPGTLCNVWSGIDWQQASQNPPQDSFLEQAFRDGVFSHQDRHLPGIFQTGEQTGGGNLVHTFGVDGTDEESITPALLWGRKGVAEYQEYYRRYLRGFDRMTLAATGGMLGVRESRRITGQYVLGLDDFKTCAVFDDEIGRFSYPVDLHASQPDKESYAQFEKEFRELRYPPGQSYGIPYRALTPRGLDNVLVAGRCISADRYMQSSIRVMPGCFITGQAAGVAAALAVERGVATTEVDPGEIQQRLKALGAYLPNARE
jgi:hypothetical protein